MKEHKQRLHFAGSSPFFQNRDGHTLTRAGSAYILGKYVKDARQARTIPRHANVSPHGLRRSKAMRLLQAGVNLVCIRALLGHADVITTEIDARADEHFSTGRSKSYAGMRDTTVAKGRRFARLAQKPRQIILDYGKSFPGYWAIYHIFEGGDFP